MSHWRPIESAPRDGTRVLLICPDYKPGYRVHIGYWVDSETIKYGVSTSRDQYWVIIGGLRFDRDASHPTLWMPLPEEL